MRLAATALILIAATVSTPVIAGDPKPTAPEAEKKKEPKAEKKICRNVSEMGSRRSKRMCMTRDEWVDFNQGN